jgi:large repetitive protein
MRNVRSHGRNRLAVIAALAAAGALVVPLGTAAALAGQDATGTVTAAGAAAAVGQELPVQEVEGRAPVALPTDGGVYVGWRLRADDPADIAFHVYRDGERITKRPVTGATNLVDPDGGKGSTYRVAEVTRGVQTWATPEVTPLAASQRDVPIQRPAGGTTPDGVAYTYSANDASVADLDGGGDYELIVKWDPSNAKDNSQSGYTGNVYLDAYKLNGTRLWRIDLGRNIRAGAHYTQFLAYDFDSSGDAEVMVKTADGTVSGTGRVIGSASADHRNSAGYVLAGPEYLTVFDGNTGAEADTVSYTPPRGNVGSWGDTYGNRVDRFLAGVAYLDGSRPSAVFTRGYYTRTVLAAYDYSGGELTRRWVFDSDSAGSQYRGQGNHQLSVADVDGDRRDEIVFGSMTIDDNGSALYNTGLGHGDALHVGDLDPARSGLEVFAVHESPASNGNRAATFRDARTGAVLWSASGTSDTGRGAAADIDASSPGAEAWNSGASPTGGLRSVSGRLLSSSPPVANFVTWWDGDTQREITDHTSNTPTVSEWNGGGLTRLETFSGTSTNNGTKATPALQADIMGDWREELIYRTSDSSALRIFSTSHPTTKVLPSLMDDRQYRLAVAWQNVAYNQPPHPSYFIGN